MSKRYVRYVVGNGALVLNAVYEHVETESEPSLDHGVKHQRAAADYWKVRDENGKLAGDYCYAFIPWVPQSGDWVKRSDGVVYSLGVAQGTGFHLLKDGHHVIEGEYWIHASSLSAFRGWTPVLGVAPAGEAPPNGYPLALNTPLNGPLAAKPEVESAETRQPKITYGSCMCCGAGEPGRKRNLTDGLCAWCHGRIERDVKALTKKCRASDLRYIEWRGRPGGQPDFKGAKVSIAMYRALTSEPERKTCIRKTRFK